MSASKWLAALSLTSDNNVTLVDPVMLVELIQTAPIGPLERQLIAAWIESGAPIKKKRGRPRSAEAKLIEWDLLKKRVRWIRKNRTVEDLARQKKARKAYDRGETKDAMLAIGCFESKPKLLALSKHKPTVKQAIEAAVEDHLWHGTAGELQPGTPGAVRIHGSYRELVEKLTNRMAGKNGHERRVRQRNIRPLLAGN